MTHTHLQSKKILATVALLFLSLTFISAQSVVEVVNDTDHSVVFRIDNIDIEETPQKIVLVYDSNLITLESTSVKTRFIRSNTRTNANVNNKNEATAMVSMLAVEFEKEMEIENWMLHSFETTAMAIQKTDNEEEIVIEDWMTNLDSWNN